jgi:hypothetical protein
MQAALDSGIDAHAVDGAVDHMHASTEVSAAG